MSEARIVDCNSPDFIRRYFATSRLHHLSTWKAELADFVADHMSLQNRSLAVAKKRASDVEEPFRTIMHIDMDCFFASVGIRDKPHLRNRPVAVAHSLGGVSLEYSTSEIASCNYIAREKGVKNGMFIGSAKELCPELIIIPYNFQAYDACSRLLYKSLLDAADYVQSVSCDEAFIDVTYRVQKALLKHTNATSIKDCCNDDPGLLDVFRSKAIVIANTIREEIFQTTQCHASVGIAGNVLLARVATHRAKPDGVFSLLSRDQAVQHVRGLSIRDLPGMGRSTSEKCAQLGLLTCADVQSGGSCGSGNGSGGVLGRLKAELGEKTGEMLHDYCWGVDPRVLENKPRQTVGADINWGIRFSSEEQVQTFLREFCAEVYSRLAALHQTAKHVTVNVKKKDYEGEPGKFLGCGRCIDFSRSTVLGRAISSAAGLYQCVTQLYREIGVQPLDARGIGIHLKKLQPIAGFAVRAAGAPSTVIGRYLWPQNTKPCAASPATVVVGPSPGIGTCNHVICARVDNEEEEENDEAETQNILSSSGCGWDAETHRPSGATVFSSRQQMHTSEYLESATENIKAASTRAEFPQSEPDILLCSSSVYATASAEAPLQVAVAAGGKSGTSEAATLCDQVISKRSSSANISDSKKNFATEGSMNNAGTVSTAAGSTHGMISMGDIDLDVFLALPEDIQKELQVAMGGTTGSSSRESRGSHAESKPAAPANKRKAQSGQEQGKKNKNVKAEVGRDKRQQGLMEAWKRTT